MLENLEMITFYYFNPYLKIDFILFECTVLTISFLIAIILRESGKFSIFNGLNYLFFQLVKLPM